MGSGLATMSELVCTDLVCFLNMIRLTSGVQLLDTTVLQLST